MLILRQPIYIDGDNRIYDNNKEFIDYYANLSKRSESNVRTLQNGGAIQNTTYQTITTKREIYVINGEEFEKIRVENDGNIRLKSLLTGEIKMFNMKNFNKTSSSVMQYNSNSNIKLPSNIQIEERSKLSYPNKHIIYNG